MTRGSHDDPLKWFLPFVIGISAIIAMTLFTGAMVDNSRRMNVCVVELRAQRTIADSLALLKREPDCASVVR